MTKVAFLFYKCPTIKKIKFIFNLQNYLEPTVCVFGFEFNPIDGECHLTKNIAGKVDRTSTDLFIICPIGYTYPGSGKLCEKAADRRFMINAPIVCSDGSLPNLKGECRQIW